MRTQDKPAPKIGIVRQQNMPERDAVCATCGKPYRTKWKKSRFCSPKCHKQFYNAITCRALRHWYSCPLAEQERNEG